MELNKINAKWVHLPRDGAIAMLLLCRKVECGKDGILLLPTTSLASLRSQINSIIQHKQNENSAMNSFEHLFSTKWYLWPKGGTPNLSEKGWHDVIRPHNIIQSYTELLLAINVCTEVRKKLDEFPGHFLIFIQPIWVPSIIINN